jgi:hypothetical protein
VDIIRNNQRDEYVREERKTKNFLSVSLVSS